MIDGPGAKTAGPGLSRRAALGAVGLIAGAQVAPTGSAGGQGEPALAQPRPRDEREEVLEVGPGKRFPSLTLAGVFMNSDERWANGYADAERRAQMRFRLIVSPGPPGYYTNDSGSRSRRWPEVVGWPPYDGELRGPVTVEGEPGKPPPMLDTDGYGDGVLYYQKGLFNTGAFDTTFKRLTFKGFRRQDGNGNYAAVRIGDNPSGPRHTVTFEDCEISGCDNGIMGGGGAQSITVKRCYFHDNGNGNGRVHNIYIGMADELIVEDLLSTRCTIGHLLKTRAASTTIMNSRLLGGSGSESACLDAPNAGVLDVDGLVCEKSADSDASWIIHYAGENQDDAGMPFHPNSSIRLRDLTLLAPPELKRHPASRVRGFANMSGAGAAVSGRGSRFIAADAQDIQAYGLPGQAAGLPARVLSQRPPLDLRSPVSR